MNSLRPEMSSPFARFLGVRFEEDSQGIVGVMPFAPSLIGNPIVNALHGGATGAFLELVGQKTLIKELDLQAATPKTIDISIDYLRSGKPVDSYARAIILRRGRRVSNIRVEMWQDDPQKLTATAHGHFLLPSFA